MTIPGPPSDAYNHKDGIYIIASNMMAVDAAKNSKAKILSPWLIGKQHPEVCFSFLVYFSVNIFCYFTFYLKSSDL